MKNNLTLIAYFICATSMTSHVFGQATSSDPTRTASVTAPNTPSTIGGDYLGWAAGVGLNLDIKNYDINKSIDFYSDFANQAFKRMTILGNNNSWSLVGIGTATPSVNLDVQDATNGGRISLGGANSSAYMIGANNILWHNGIVPAGCSRS